MNKFLKFRRYPN